MKRLRGLCGWLLAVGAMGSASADSVLVFQGTGLSSHEIAIAGGRVAMQQAGQQVIFDSQRQTLAVLQPAEKRYVLIDEAGARQMGATATGLMQGLESALAQLPPEQRAQLQGAMGQMGAEPASLVPTLSMNDSGRSSQVGGRRCRIWQTLVNGRLETEQCLVARSSLGLPAEDSRTLDAFVGFTERMAATMGPLGGMVAELKNLRDQFPVQTTEFAGKRRLVRELAVQSHARLPAARFEIPAGYQRQELGSLLRNVKRP